MNDTIKKLQYKGISFSDKDLEILETFLAFEKIHTYINNQIKKNEQALWTKNGVMQLIKQAFPEEFQIINQEKQKESYIIELLSSEKKKYKSLGIGIIHDRLYFGTVLNGCNVVVTDDRRIYTSGLIQKGYDEIKDKLGLNYRFDLFEDVIDYPWSNESIKEWIEGEAPQVKIGELFQRIKEINKYYVDHYDEAIHDYVACDIISNYFYPIFEAKGRTYFQAEYESGKSRQSSIYKLLSFNSLMAGNITPASFERVIESTGGTIIVDNLDNLSEEVQRLVYQAIEVYYKKGGKTIKSDGNNNKPIAYEGYSPLVLNNIIGLPEVTESRCNKLLMLKSENYELTKRKIREDNLQWEELRNKLRYCAFQNWKQVKSVYDHLEVEELSNRDFEKSEAVLTIAKIVGENTFQEILRYIIKINQQSKIKELDNNWEFTTLNILYEMLNEKEIDYLRVKVRDISEIACERLGIDPNDNMKLKLSHFIGKLLGNYPQLFSKKTIRAYTHYYITRKALEKLIRMKGYGEAIGIGESRNNLTQHYPTLSYPTLYYPTLPFSSHIKSLDISTLSFYNTEGKVVRLGKVGYGGKRGSGKNLSLYQERGITNLTTPYQQYHFSSNKARVTMNEDIDLSAITEDLR